MKKERIELLINSGQIRIRKADIQKIVSIISSAQTNVKIVKEIPLNEESSTVIFREIYESIRQLGDAKWCLLGYEPLNHEVSIEILKEMDIKEKIRLNHLPRFKSIRNDANYRGFRVNISQAREIQEFWDMCANEIIKNIKRELDNA